MVSSHSFGSYVYDKGALLGLGFPMSSPKNFGVKQTVNVNSLTHSSIGTTLSRLNRDSVCLLANGFSFYFTPISGFFSPFPHGTSSLSVSLSIQSWVVTDPDSYKVCRDSQYLGTEQGYLGFEIQGYHFLRPLFPKRFFILNKSHIICPATSLTCVKNLDCGPFARRYQGYHYCFIFLRVLRCFSSPSALLKKETKRQKPRKNLPQLLTSSFLPKILWLSPEGVTPFGNQRLIASI